MNDTWSSLGVSITQSVLVLLGVLALMVVVLHFLAKFRAGFVQENLRVLARLPLGRRSSVGVIRVGQRVFLIGLCDGSPPTMLSELESSEWPDQMIAAQPLVFRDVLERFRSKGDPKNP